MGNASDWTAAILRDKCSGIVAEVRTAGATHDPAALEAEAAMYDRGCGVDQNMMRAVELYAQATASGAQDDLAKGYVDLYGSTPSESTGVSQLTEAVQSGNRLAAFDLCFYFNHRLENPKTDYAMAAHWASLGAAFGDDVAALMLGTFLHNGAGIAKNLPLGRRYIDRAFVAEIPDALAYVGLQTMYGSDGYPKNRLRGFQLIRKAISLGLTRAKLMLVQNTSSVDFAANRVSKSEVKADIEAAALIEPRRFYRDYVLGEYYSHNPSSGQPDCVHAVPLLLKVADSTDDANPAYAIAYCYSYAPGYLRDADVAFKYFKLAAALGDPDAIAFLRTEPFSHTDTAAGSTVNDDYARSYEGYHWSELHPMTSMPLPGSPGAPASH